MPSMEEISFELMKDINDILSETHFGEFWEYVGVTVEIKDTIRDVNGMHIDIKMNPGYLSPKAGAPC